PLCAMAGEALEEDMLLQKLRDSRRRFQRRMQELIEKYNQPFEDDPLVQMATLTYETPQGLRIWGGRLIKERNKGQIQDSPVRPVDRIDGPMQATAQGHERPAQGMHVLGADSKSSDVDATLDQDDPVAWAITPAAPQSPLKNELRRKYLTQVDILLQDSGCWEAADDRAGKDIVMALPPPLAAPAPPASGSDGGLSGKSPGDTAQPASSPRQWDPSRPCSTDLAIVPRNDSLPLLGTSSSSFLSSQSFGDDDICNATISDLYEGMLHSMSRLLSTRSSGIISTKTFIMQNWNSQRRHKCKRMNRTFCRGARRPQRGSRERPSPHSEPGKERGALRDCKNLLDVSCHNTSLKLRKAYLEVKPQVHKLDPSWKELQVLQVTPKKCSSLTYLDPSRTHHPDQENRFMKLKWLISPVKIVSRPTILPGHRENHQREIEIRFDKLYQEYCLSPRKPPPLTSLPNSWAVAVYKGGPESPRGHRGLETHRLSLPFSRVKSKRLNKAFETIGRKSMEVSGHLPKRDLSSLSQSTSPIWSPGHSWQTSVLHFQGNSYGIVRKSVSPSRAIPIPKIEPLGYGRNRYDEIKEQFDKLHQKYCPKLPVQMKAPLGTRASPHKASTKVRYQTKDLGKLNLDSLFQGSPKLSSSLPKCRRSLLGSGAIQAHPSAQVPCATGRGSQCPAKRLRLSDPCSYGRHIDSQDSSGGVGRAVFRPGEQDCCLWPDSED
uniref:Holliday junction recognition protein n=1 Tax=Otolemur garnettii TaxID=30611 RepID=H0XC79_OTOGA